MCQYIYLVKKNFTSYILCSQPCHCLHTSTLSASDLPITFFMSGYSYLHILFISSSMAVSATLNVKEVSLNRRFSVGTKPSKNMFIPVIKIKFHHHHLNNQHMKRYTCTKTLFKEMQFKFVNLILSK